MPYYNTMVPPMKAFLLLASLSFASAIMLVPHDGNDMRPSVNDTVISDNSTDTSNHFVNHLNFTNDVNTKYRPHLAIVENRKLFQDVDTYTDTEDGDDEDNDNDEDDAEGSIPDGRRLLKSRRRRSRATPKATHQKS